MNLSEKINKRTIHLLKENPTLRDNFLQFLAIYWRNEIPKEKQKDSQFVFLGRLYRGEVTDPKTLSRTWRQVQREISDLRGKDWNDRQKYSKKDVPPAINKNAVQINDEIELDLFY